MSDTSINQLSGPQYPVIDTDPKFSRVVRYMRPTDYAAWAGATAGLPALMYAWEKLDYTSATARQMRSSVRITGVAGFCAGFLFAYQNVSQRFWGWRENAREDEKDKRELSARVQAGLPIYGQSELSPYMQGVASRNSHWAAENFAVLPWFNLVNHNDHGVDAAARYGAKRSVDQ